MLLVWTVHLLPQQRRGRAFKIQVWLWRITFFLLSVGPICDLVFHSALFHVGRNIGLTYFSTHYRRYTNGVFPVK